MNSVGARPDTTQPVGYLLILLIVLVVAANVVAEIPAWRARRIAPAQALGRE
jgi:hypothetical protein